MITQIEKTSEPIQKEVKTLNQGLAPMVQTIQKVEESLAD